MTTNDRPDTLTADYLARLRVAALTLDASARDELVDGIAGHLEDAKARAGDTWSEARLLSVQDRLGTPEEIVAAAVTAREPEPVPEPVPEPEPVLHSSSGESQWSAPPPPRTGPQAHTLGAPPPAYGPAAAPLPVATAPVSTQLELAAVLLIGLGFIVPGIGLIAGLVCLWLSKLWTTADKVVASVLVIGPSIVAVLTLPLVFLTGARPDSWPFGQAWGDMVPGLALFGLGMIGFLLPILVAVWLWSVARTRALEQV